MRCAPPRLRVYESSLQLQSASASSRQSQSASAIRNPRSAMSLRLYVEQMDAVVVEVSADGRVRLENEDWSRPTLQERRAILFAAATAIEELTELVEILQDGAAE